MKTTIRIPDLLHAEYKTLARQEHRSFRAQVVKALEEWLIWYNATTVPFNYWRTSYEPNDE